MLGLMGVGAIIAVAGLLLFVGLVVAAVFFGKSNAGRPMEAWHTESPVAASTSVPDSGQLGTPGTMTLVLIFLLVFVVYYFANWLWLSDVWQVR
jgi:cytochrome c oxidase subunit 1